MDDIRVLDMLGQPVEVGSFVVMHNNIYEVLECGRPGRTMGNRIRDWAACRILLVKKSKSTKPIHRPSYELVVIPGPAVTQWLLRR